jgi:hypothetical protein
MNNYFIQGDSNHEEEKLHSADCAGLCVRISANIPYGKNVCSGTR